MAENTDTNQASAPGKGSEAATGRQRVTAMVSRAQFRMNDAANAPDAAPPGPRGNGEIARAIHWALRGRYALVIVFGLVTGAVAAAAVWRLARPEYQSAGLMRIAYTLPEVMQETDQNRPVLMFDAFMASQRLLITSRRVIDIAVQDPIWKATGRPVPTAADRYFAEHLAVEVKPRSEFISITVTDPDPGTAAAAVTAIINSYSELYNSQNKQLDRQRIGVLEDRQTFLQNRIEEVSSQIRSGAQEYGTTNLDDFYDGKAAEVRGLETELAQLRRAIAAARGGAAKLAAPATQPAEAQLASSSEPGAAAAAAELFTSDPVMRDFLAEESRLESELSRLGTIGYGDAHRSVILVKQSLGEVRTRIQKYQTARANAPAQPRGLTPVAPGDAPVTMEDLRTTEASLLKLHQETRREMVAVGAKRLELQRQSEELGTLREELSKLTKRIEVLRAEGSLGGRLSIINSGEIPLSPFRDRRPQFAAAAGLAGASLPAGLLLAVALVWRKYRYSDETEADVSGAGMPLLGIIPEIKEGAGDAEEVAAAAHCVHQIRVSIRAQSRDGGPQVYLITSATPSEGKTSLTLSLGLSFAAAKLRTLVIDGDLVGRRLTTQFGVRDSVGLRDALSAGQLDPYLRKSSAGFSFLSAGRGEANDASAISSAQLRVLIDAARKDFDVVLIDSGPILGSVEASVFAQEVDGVIFTLGRGQHRPTVQAAMRRLNSLGVADMGLVFNRARWADVRSSSSAYSSSSRSELPGDKGRATKPVADPLATARAERLKRFGPLVQAVAMRTVAPRN